MTRTEKLDKLSSLLLQRSGLIRAERCAEANRDYLADVGEILAARGLPPLPTGAPLTAAPGPDGLLVLTYDDGSPEPAAQEPTP